MPVVITPQMKLGAYGVATFCSAALLAHFFVSLPDAIDRGREGVRRTREAPCQVLKPAPQNVVLGKLPQPAPDFELKGYDGNPVRLSSLRGRVVLLNFWATWCETCTVEEPSLKRLAERMKARNRPFTLLAVSVDENWDVIRQHFPEGTAMTVLLDKERAVPAKYGTEKFPESFLIDPEGNIRYFVISERQTWHTREIEQCIEALLE